MKVLTIYFAATILIMIVKTVLFYLIQKLKSYKEPRNERIDELALNISRRFNHLMKARVLTRKDILIIRNICNRYVSTNKKFENDCHRIYWVLKYANIQRKDIANIELILDTAEINHKKKARR